MTLNKRKIQHATSQDHAAPYQADCPFCNLPQERLIYSDEIANIFADGYPVSPGHLLITSRCHYPTLFDVPAEEQTHLLSLINQAKDLIGQFYRPDGYNVGINNGAAAGQTVPHVHIHVIPRYDGDVEDPRGGVRWVIPDKAKYWP